MYEIENGNDILVCSSVMVLIQANIFSFSKLPLLTTSVALEQSLIFRTFYSELNSLGLVKILFVDVGVLPF